MNFKIGDIVKAIDKVDGIAWLIGEIGIVRDININNSEIGVEFINLNLDNLDDYKKSILHSINGRIKQCKGRYGRYSAFMLINQIIEKKVDKFKLIISEENIAIIDNNNCIEISKENLKEIKEKIK